MLTNFVKSLQIQIGFYMLLIGCLVACDSPHHKAIQEKPKYLMSAQASPSIPLIPTQNKYLWMKEGAYDIKNSLQNRIPLPQGYTRSPETEGSFQDWLRNLPLKPAGSKVYLYNGKELSDQKRHISVVDIDVGKKDLQQCADAIMRLRAEYLYALEEYDGIHFNFTNGENVPYAKWKSGYTISLKNNKVNWLRDPQGNTSYKSFRKYMEWIFMYAGTASLSQELKEVESIRDIQIGDILIRGGSPGHAVIVIDMALNDKTGEKAFMLAQSFMPAQNVHVLLNPNANTRTPWYTLKDLSKDGYLATPSWYFRQEELKRFN